MPPESFEKVVFLATAWGSRLGGINAFNVDLVVHLASLLHSKYEVCCIVLNTEPTDIEEAKEKQVTLVSLEVASENYEESHSYQIIHALEANSPIENVAWWIGHDLVSGKIANKLRDIGRAGKSAVIKHMSYIDYFGYKHGKAQMAEHKYNDQLSVFNGADQLFAVGPLLRDRLLEMVDTSVTMLVPGLVANTKAKPTKNFRALTFGRLDPENDRIKQPKLAVHAFASAVKIANEDKDRPECFRKQPRMYLFGVSEHEGTEEAELIEYAKETAGRVVNILPLPYTEDRDKLLQNVATSSVAMMLSWHEGFGLTGWEAISAEVPLIVSVHSGLYQFIQETLGGAGEGCLWPVDVKGELGDEETPNFTTDTAENITRLLLVCASRLEEAQQDAKTLKKMLEVMGCNWETTAIDFARPLDLTFKENPHPHTFHTPLAVARRAKLADQLDETMHSIGDLQAAMIERKAGAERPAEDGSSTKLDEILSGRILDQRNTIKQLERINRGLTKKITRLIDTPDTSPPEFLLPLIKKAVCYNQGEYSQYSFLAASFHKKLRQQLDRADADLQKISDYKDHLELFLRRNLMRISTTNFSYINSYFKDRHSISPRVCIKGSVLDHEEEHIAEIVRESSVNYFSEYPLGANSGFVFVKENGTYFLCNDIPESLAHGHYVNARVNLNKARQYHKDSAAQNKAGKNRPRASKPVFHHDEEWMNCWINPSIANETPSETDPTSCYKSTLIVPMTLWNIELEEIFRNKIQATDIGRAIFGYLCFDHVDVGFFKDEDIELGYIFADILSLYFIARATYTDFSDTYKNAILAQEKS